MQTYHPSLQIRLFTGWIGLLGALLVGVGEFLLHYSSAIGTSSEFLGFFTTVPASNLMRGHRIAIIGVPLYFVGYYHLYRELKPASPMRAGVFFCIGIIAFTLGGMWIASRGFIGSIVHLQAGIPSDIYTTLLSQYEFFGESLVQILRVAIVLLSVLWVALLATGKTIYSKRMMVLNPLLLLVSIFGVYRIIPSIGKFIAPIAMNVVHAILFGASLIAVTFTIQES